MKDITVNRFRSARGRILHQKILALRETLGRDITVLDVGGRPDYWLNVGTEGCAKIILMNYDPAELDRETPGDLFEKVLGDATDLSEHADNQYDLVHSNSVIEHVGDWTRMEAMAQELVRVGQAGWVQTPAFAFPVEPHYRMPFAHWLPAPLRRAYIGLGPYKGCSIGERRMHVDRINLMTHSEVRELFPGLEIWVERIALLPKSYVVKW